MLFQEPLQPQTDWCHDALIILPLEDLEISELMPFYLSFVNNTNADMLGG